MREVTGDLLDGTYRVIGHGVNCSGSMGAGIAAAIADRWPTMYGKYADVCHRGILQPGGFYPWYTGAEDLWVYNLASQNAPGADARLEWLDASLTAALKHARLLHLPEFAIPRIGCGIGGLDWDEVQTLLRRVELASDRGTPELTVVTYDG